MSKRRGTGDERLRGEQLANEVLAQEDFSGFLRRLGSEMEDVYLFRLVDAYTELKDRLGPVSAAIDRMTKR